MKELLEDWLCAILLAAMFLYLLGWFLTGIFDWCDL
jgi:hypothetical protein